MREGRGGGRPPSDDVLVRCDTRDAWDLIGSAGVNSYFFHQDYLGRLDGGQNVAIRRRSAPCRANRTAEIGPIAIKIGLLLRWQPFLSSSTVRNTFRNTRDPWLIPSIAPSPKKS